MSFKKTYSGDALKKCFHLVLDENQRIANNLNYENVVVLLDLILNANRIFVKGVGRSGLALAGFAMRLIHLGFNVSIVGEITAPPISEGDLLILASGSGTTSSVIATAQKARKEKAKVAVFTTDKESLLAEIADHISLIPAATKYDYGDQVSRQYAGTLFEQSLFLICDAVFKVFWDQNGVSAEEMIKRHSNLE